MPTIYKPQVYLIRTLSNLHVGGGSSNFDYVDKQVQRDPTTNNPTIFSSSLKGALRDYLAETGLAKEIITHIFGNEPGDKESKQGAYRFLSADLLAIPQLVADPEITATFKLVNSKVIVEAFKEKVSLMQEGQKDFSIPKIGEAQDLAFKELVNELPVLSRNHLENGVSQNLWYEEVVPREAIFGVVLLAPAADKHIKDFEAHIDNKVIQIGANATIGYGLCHFQKII